MKGFRLYSFISAIGIILGESYFIFTTNKFLPLWLDDYFIAMCMLFALYIKDAVASRALVFASWTFIFGNLYAMLFSRLEPINPEGRPWMLLAILVVWAFISSGVAFLHVIKKK
jgi:hypothetical protein